jgi:hypothetical protein
MGLAPHLRHMIAEFKSVGPSQGAGASLLLAATAFVGLTGYLVIR